MVNTPHKRAATVHLIRREAMELAKNDNQVDAQHVFTTDAIATGVRVTATNPFTHAKVSYTIKASGKHAVVHGPVRSRGTEQCIPSGLYGPISRAPVLVPAVGGAEPVSSAPKVRWAAATRAVS